MSYNNFRPTIHLQFQTPRFSNNVILRTRKRKIGFREFSPSISNGSPRISMYSSGAHEYILY